MSQATLKKRRIYPGWWIVITGILLMAIIFASVISLPGVFTIYVTEEFGISRTAFTTHMTISTLSSMLAALFVGKILQKYNIKLLMAAFTLVSIICFTAYSFATQLWHFYIISAVIGFCLMFLTGVPISILVNNWFGPKMKGKALGIAMTGSGIGAMVFNPVLGFINSTYGWRVSYRLLALLTLVIILPLVLITVEKSPAEKGVARLGDVEGGPHASDTVAGLTTSQAFRSVMFWVLFLSFFLFAMTTTVFNVNGMPYFTDIGFDVVKAASMMSIASLAVIFGKLLLGAACDKWGARIGAAGAIALLITGMILLIGAAKLSVLGFAAVAIFGLGNALGTVTVPLIVAELFGNRDFGSLVGICNMATSLGASIGPLFGAIVYDQSGSYIAAWTGDIALMVVMLVTVTVAYKVKRSAYAKVESRAAKP